MRLLIQIKGWEMAHYVKKVKDDVKVTTKWIDEATKESLTKVVIGDKPVEPGTIKGYTFVRTEHPTESEYIHVFKKNEKDALLSYKVRYNVYIELWKES